MINARKIALDALLKIEKDRAYSNLTLDSFLEKYNPDSRDRGFISALFYGVTEKKLTLDYNLSQYLDKPLKKLKAEVLVILRIGAYQILFMDKVPSSAAVNESVRLSKKYCSFASGLINAVLRKIDKNGLVLPDGKDKAFYLSVKYSCSEWICEKWIKEYGEENAEKILIASLGAPDTFIRVNTTKITENDLIDILKSEGVLSEKTYLPNALKISFNSKNPESLESFKKGYFHVQDLASQLCIKALSPQKNETILDLCSAPGGKAYTAAEYMKNTGCVFCFDIYEHRVELIKKGAVRLGLTAIKGEVSDALEFRSDLKNTDRVLCDVPCSGLGIIRRKPEIKYKTYEEIKDLPQIQYNILKIASRYVKQGGRLVYSTCTLSKAENEEVCSRFLSEYPAFSVIRPLKDISDEDFITLMPHKNLSDGFFIACFERKE